jgi:hypothetical protein
LKKQTADLLADAFIALIEKIGVSASEVYEALLRAPIPEEYKSIAHQSSSVGLAQKLLPLPEPSKEDITKALAMIGALEKMPQLMRPLLRKAAKELPRTKGGPRAKLTYEQKAVACAEILALRSEYSDREAVQQTARKYRVSERTIYRIWSEYRRRRTRKT